MSPRSVSAPGQRGAEQEGDTEGPGGATPKATGVWQKVVHGAGVTRAGIANCGTSPSADAEVCIGMWAVRGES